MHTVDALATLELPSRTISRLVSLPPPTAALRILWNHPVPERRGPNLTIPGPTSSLTSPTVAHARHTGGRVHQ
jgi:hypothetical protein